MPVALLAARLSARWRSPAASFLPLLTVAVVLLFSSLPADAAGSCPRLLQHTFPTLLDEKPASLCQYEGKVLLVVNTASYCGFTPQYEALEKLHARLASRGLVVLGFPANDFGRQEPGSNKQIAEFCALTYGVKFPMFAKTVVAGNRANPFYKELAAATGKAPGWNFHKYLIDRSGTRVVSFDSQVSPDDRRLMSQLESFLGTP